MLVNHTKEFDQFKPHCSLWLIGKIHKWFVFMNDVKSLMTIYVDQANRSKKNKETQVQEKICIYKQRWMFEYSFKYFTQVEVQ